jgi:hypothetical protein
MGVRSTLTKCFLNYSFQERDAAVWRGPMVMGAVEKLLKGVYDLKCAELYRVCQRVCLVFRVLTV